jgi:CHASE2 domain-containing sensor protein
MSYCVVSVVLYLYGSFPPVVCSVGGLVLFVLCCTFTDIYLQLCVV